MVCFDAGIATRACSQNAASVGRASGSFSMPRWISRSLRERRPFQSEKQAAGFAAYLTRFASRASTHRPPSRR